MKKYKRGKCIRSADKLDRHIAIGGEVWIQEPLQYGHHLPDPGQFEFVDVMLKLRRQEIFEAVETETDET